MATPTLFYDPPTHESTYYEELFSLADPSHVGHIQGRDAVAFLARSHLPMESLKAIWGMADTNPTTNSLDKKKFFAVVRLIQLSQNGKTATGPNLLVTEGTLMHPPYFDGVTGVVLQPFTEANATTSSTRSLPTTLAPSSTVATAALTAARSTSPIQEPVVHNQALALGDPYIMQPGEQNKYESLFPQFEKDGFVYGQAAVTLFSKSGLENDILRDIWNLVDNPVDNRLSKIEFAIAMHLIVCISKKNLPMPTTMPPSLEALKKTELAKQYHPTHTLPSAPSTPTPATNIALGGHPPSPSKNSGRLSIGEAFEDLNPQPNPTYMPPLQLSSNTADMGPSMTTTTTTITMQQQAGATTSSTGTSYLMGTHLADNGLMAPPSLTTTSSSARSVTTIPLQEGPTSVGPSLITAAAAQGKIHEMGYSASANTDTSMEQVIQLRSILQTLQAENISLKAQISQFSEEEKQVRSEITYTSTEIVSLLQELTGLRNRVAEARILLLEATAELKVLTDKKEALKDLISQEQTTLTSTQAAVENVHGAIEGFQQMKIQDKNQDTIQAPPAVVEHNFLDLDSFIQVQTTPLPPLSQPLMETPQHHDVRPPSDFIVYPVPDIPEYNPGVLMGGTSISTVNRMGTGSVDLSVGGGDYSIASTAEYPYGGAPHPNTTQNYYWNPEEMHAESEPPAVGEDHPVMMESEKHSKDSKKWTGFLRKSGGKSSKSIATI